MSRFIRGTIGSAIAGYAWQNRRSIIDTVRSWVGAGDERTRRATAAQR